MTKLLQLGADPAKLYEQFRQRAKETEAQQEDVQRAAHATLTEQVVSGPMMSVRAYRQAREAETHLLANPVSDDMPYSDYKKMREAEQAGRRPQTYEEFSRQHSSVEAAPEPPVSNQPRTTGEEIDIEEYRQSREQDLKPIHFRNPGKE